MEFHSGSIALHTEPDVSIYMRIRTRDPYEKKGLGRVENPMKPYGFEGFADFPMIMSGSV